MTSRIRASLVALAILAALASAYVIVAQNGPKGRSGKYRWG